MVDGLEEAQTFDGAAAWTPVWAVRDGSGDDAAALRQAIEGFTFPPGEGFVWIAAESQVARAIRAYVVEERGHKREWIKAAGYWRRGEADAHERIED